MRECPRKFISACCHRRDEGFEGGGKGPVSPSVLQPSAGALACSPQLLRELGAGNKNERVDDKEDSLFLHPSASLIFSGYTLTSEDSLLMRRKNIL